MVSDGRTGSAHDPDANDRRPGPGPASTSDLWELVRISNAVMCIADGDGRLLFANDALARLVRVDPDELVGHRWIEWVHPDDRARTSKVIDALVRQGGSVAGLTNRYRSNDGSYRWLEWQLTADPQTGQVFGVAVDVTGRRHAQERLDEKQAELEASLHTLREHQQRLRLAVETTHLGIWEHDLPDDVVRWSAQTARIFGLPAEPTTTTVEDYFDRVHPDDREFLHDFVDAPRDRSDIEYRIVRPDGQIRWVASNATVQHDDHGEPTCVIGTLLDITDRVEGQERLQAAKDEAERANTAMSELLRRTSHELRTPLNAILGFSRLLTADDLTEQQHDSVREIVAAGERLLDLIDRVLAINADAAGRARPRERLDLPSMLSQAIERLRALAQQHDVLLRLVLPDEPLVALADPSKVEHVTLDLLSNAILYSGGDEVQVSVRPVDDDRLPCLRVEIRDRGPGLEPDELERAFTPFDRLGADGTDVDGVGLGLPLSRRLLESMGGRLGADSTPGYGSCFWFELARAPASEEA